MRHIKHKVFIIIVMIYLFIPLVATFLFSVATKWQVTILPEGYTLEWYGKLFHDTRFLQALARSFLASGLSVAVTAAVTIPAVFAVVVYFPSMEKLLNIIVMIPFAIPGVVSAVGLIKMYSQGPLVLSGTVWLLAGAYFVVILPFMYQGVSSSLKTINAGVLMEAAETLSASRFQAFSHIILPNIAKGIVISCLLSFSILFGEFVLANILVGGNFETVQVYLFSKRAESGHFTSSIVIVYFIGVLILTGLITFLNKPRFSSGKEAD